MNGLPVIAGYEPGVAGRITIMSLTDEFDTVTMDNQPGEQVVVTRMPLSDGLPGLAPAVKALLNEQMLDQMVARQSGNLPVVISVHALCGLTTQRTRDRLHLSPRHHLHDPALVNDSVDDQRRQLGKQGSDQVKIAPLSACRMANDHKGLGHHRFCSRADVLIGSTMLLSWSQAAITCRAVVSLLRNPRRSCRLLRSPAGSVLVWSRLVW
jgi:hypothetical protein